MLSAAILSNGNINNQNGDIVTGVNALRVKMTGVDGTLLDKSLLNVDDNDVDAVSNV